ncbi:MAG: 2-amino-4-hydroxy-6-hydroxymethyldihydropteridine diphosphokinase [Bacteroidia bacterium]|nr:2-amino-4-hydroxy-6-hydroxymethyldihydropteridine diphosphokinase [Bacteroidia bacterium]
MNTKVLLSAGSNAGDSLNHLNSAVALLNATGLVNVLSSSSVYKTDPWGKTDQESFYNIALLAECTVDVGELMRIILNTEEKLGRVRAEKWGPRIIDIDIILFGDVVVNTEHVIVPHPHFRDRLFVLKPAAEIAPDLLDPVTGKTIKELLDLCPDTGGVELI